MIDASVQTNVKSKPILPLSTTLGPVHIAVTDRAKALAIWQDVVGLDLIAETGNALTLGAGGKPLIVLETGAVRPVVPRTIGLYHVAIHVPKRADLAQMAVRALQRNVRISPTDHLVSEAIYLWDLDGNGIEITFETPWRGSLGDPDKGETYAVTTERQAAFGPRSDRSWMACWANSDQRRCWRRACLLARASATCMCMSTTCTWRWISIATSSALPASC